jgi:hypothetical protein
MCLEIFHQQIGIDEIQSVFSHMIDSMCKEHLNFLNKYLATFKGSKDDADPISSKKEEVVATIIDFVKPSNIFQVLILHFTSLYSFI